MAQYLVSYFRISAGFGAYESHVFEFDPEPALGTYGEINALQAILALECEGDNAIYISHDRLPTQAEHPCPGPPYTYWVVYQVQQKQGTIIRQLGLGNLHHLSATPVQSEEDLRLIETVLRERIGYHESVAMRILPATGFPQEEIENFNRRWPGGDPE